MTLNLNCDLRKTANREFFISLRRSKISKIYPICNTILVLHRVYNLDLYWTWESVELCKEFETVGLHNYNLFRKHFHILFAT